MELELRPWVLKDATSLTENINNIQIWNNVRDRLPFPYTREDADFFIASVRGKSEPITNLAIVINGNAVGGIGFTVGEDVNRISAEVGYWLGEEYWGKGIMTEALSRGVDYAYNKLPQITRLFAEVFENNIASMKVLEKVGFEKEAILKKAIIKNNIIMDLHLYGLVRK